MLDEFKWAILLHGNNWELVREIARSMERTIFLAGYHKAFALVCGPCWLCKTCVVARPKGGVVAACRHPDKARPAMEASGIDVFATARAAGLPIEVVQSEECPQNYYALVLVE
jgi:predicted metal-binding protein